MNNTNILVNDTSQLSDEDLLRRILSELDEIKESQPQYYQRTLSRLCKIVLKDQKKGA